MASMTKFISVTIQDREKVESLLNPDHILRVTPLTEGVGSTIWLSNASLQVLDSFESIKKQLA